jgi:hypothetical protein
MKNKDLVALAALAAGAYGLKQASNVDAALGRMKYDKMAEKLGYPVGENPMSARRGGRDPLAVSIDTVSEKDKEAAYARSRAAREELNPEGRIGGPRSPVLDRSGNPITTRSGFAFTEDIPDSAVSGANFRRNLGMKKGGAVKKHAKGGSVKSTQSSASKRADGIAQRGKTRGRIV